MVNLKLQLGNVNQEYLKKKLKVELLLGQEGAWLDTGTFMDSLILEKSF